MAPMSPHSALKLCVTYGMLALTVLAPSVPMFIVCGVVIVLNLIDFIRDYRGS